MIFGKLNQKFQKTLILLRVYYITLFALLNIYGLSKLNPATEQLKPVYLFPLEFLTGANHLTVSFILTALPMFLSFAAALKPTSQSLRLLFVLSLFFFNALANSGGGLTHLWEFWLWSSVVLALLPTIVIKNDIPTKRVEKLIYLNGWWSAQAIVLLFYFLSGFWKLVGLIGQLRAGEPNFLSTDGLKYHLASEVIRAGANPLFKSIIYNQPLLSSLMAFGALVLQLSCLPIIFKVKMRPWVGMGLLFFHIGTSVFLGISYPTNFFLLGILFVVDTFPRENIGHF